MTRSAVPIDAPSASTAYIGIGSNLEHPLRQVLAARDALAALSEVRLSAFSPLYRNPALGPGRQPDYVNAVAAVETRLPPEELLAALLAIETRHGRVRNGARWKPRTLDLDLLLYGDREIESAGLKVPHPRMVERAFVLRPLHDIAPDLEVPGRGPVAALLSAVSQSALVRIDDAAMPGGTGTSNRRE